MGIGTVSIQKDSFSCNAVYKKMCLTSFIICVSIYFSRINWSIAFYSFKFPILLFLSTSLICSKLVIIHITADCGLPKNYDTIQYSGPVAGNLTTFYKSTATYTCRPGYELGNRTTTEYNSKTPINTSTDMFLFDVSKDTVVLLEDGRVLVGCAEDAEWHTIPICEKKGNSRYV